MRELLVKSGKERLSSLVIRAWDGSQIHSDSAYFCGYFLLEEFLWNPLS